MSGDAGSADLRCLLELHSNVHQGDILSSALAEDSKVLGQDVYCQTASLANSLL